MLLRRGRNSYVSLPQQQIASLLANAFLCTFPTTKHIMKTDNDMDTATYAQINNNSLFKLRGRSAAEKIKCNCSYFKVVCNCNLPIGLSVVMHWDPNAVKRTFFSLTVKLGPKEYLLAAIARAARYGRIYGLRAGYDRFGRHHVSAPPVTWAASIQCTVFTCCSRLTH